MIMFTATYNSSHFAPCLTKLPGSPHDFVCPDDFFKNTIGRIQCEEVAASVLRALQTQPSWTAVYRSALFSAYNDEFKARQQRPSPNWPSSFVFTEYGMRTELFEMALSELIGEGYLSVQHVKGGDLIGFTPKLLGCIQRYKREL